MSNKLTVEDRLDIQELFAKYAWAIDLADAEAAVACFSEDGSSDHLWRAACRGTRRSQEPVPPASITDPPR